MSESENQPTPPPPSTPKTAAVPLKKETVRITLRARPGSGTTQPREATAPVTPVSAGEPVVTAKRSTAPIQLPSAPLPPPAPKSATAPVKLPPAPVAPARKTTAAVPVVASPSPSAPSPAGAAPMARPVPPMAPAATVPMAPPRPPGAPVAPVAPVAPGAPRPPGAPAAPRPVAPGAPMAPRVETGATTTPLAKPGPRPPGAAGTAPMGAAAPGAGTGALPKATVKLQATQPMARPSVSAPPSAPVKRTAAADSQQFYEEKDPDEGLMPLSVVCLLLSVVLLVIQMGGSSEAPDFIPDAIRVPSAQLSDWEKPGQTFSLPPVP